jgi:RNA polymerase sigma-70 factor (sigma-E family)
MADQVEFDAFVVACSPRLARTAYLLVHDRQLAEDLLQTALTKAWFAWRRIEGNPEPYVRRVMVTTAVSWWRRRWVREVPSDWLPERAAPGSEVPDQDLWQALGRLPIRQRAVVVLRFYEDLTEADTADLLRCSVGTVKSQCSKALAKLRIDQTVLSVSDEGGRQS